MSFGSGRSGDARLAGKAERKGLGGVDVDVDVLESETDEKVDELAGRVCLDSFLGIAGKKKAVGDDGIWCFFFFGDGGFVNTVCKGIPSFGGWSLRLLAPRWGVVTSNVWLWFGGGC